MGNGQQEQAAHITLTVMPQLERMRLDLFLDHCFSTYTRSFFKKLIDNGAVSRNGSTVRKASTRVSAGDEITVTFPPQRTVHPLRPDHTDLGVSIIAEREDFLVVNKPAGLLVHPPAHGSSAVTLADWIVTYYPEVKDVGESDRPGIVHRLDKDTSGILLIARNTHAFEKLQAAFKQRDIIKTYYAIVHGHPPTYGTIRYNIERDPIYRQQMVHSYESGRKATTQYHVVEYLQHHALIKLRPITGRTHQLRVHCNALGHPILGDSVYGRSSKLINRQTLHAHSLTFVYENEKYHFQAPFPQDFQKTLQELRKRVHWSAYWKRLKHSG